MLLSLLFGVLVFEGARADLATLQPHPNLSARDVVEAQLEVLRDEDDADLATFLRLAEPRFASRLGGPAGLAQALDAQLDGLAGYEDFLVSPTGPRPGQTSLLVVVIQRGQPLGFVFELSKAEDACWRTMDVRRIDLPRPRPGPKAALTKI